MSLPVARSLLTAPPQTVHGAVVLTYDERLLRRKRLVTEEGESFLCDLASVTNLDDFWGFALEDGRAIEVRAAPEALVAVSGPDLLRYAWHIGNRHTPCQVEPSRLLIRLDHVLENMLTGLGAKVLKTHEPFRPEGGAYGHGRTMGHSHGPEAGQTHGPGGLHFEPEATAAQPERQDDAKAFGTVPAGIEERSTPPSGASSPARAAKPHVHRAGCGCAHTVATLAAAETTSPAPAAAHVHGAGCGCAPRPSEVKDFTPYEAWSPEVEPEGQGFGWHHHGDGKLHFHAPRAAHPDDPIGDAITLRRK